MTRTLPALLGDSGDPGAAACVVRNGEIVDEAVTGTLDGEQPWTQDTLTMTYSCAKPFAALTVLTLVRLATGDDLATRFARLADEQGWDLHLRVAPGELARVADPVAVEDGWPARYTNDPRWGPAMTRPAGLLDREVTWTLGFQVDELDIGMGGAGGSSGWWSFSGGYAAAYVSRGLGTHDRDDAVYELLEERFS